jgi:hypothetical protein
MMVLLAVALLGGAASAQQNNAEKYQKRIGELLDRVHKNPKIQPSVLAHMRERMVAKKLPDIDQRMAIVSKGFSQAATLSDAAYAAQRSQLVMQVWQQTHLSKGKGGG